MEIVEAAELHIPALLELWREFFDYHRDIDPYYARSEDALDHIGKRFREKIAERDSQVLVAVEGGAVIGYSLFWIADDSPFVREKKHGFICDLAVTSTHRSKGVGEKLLERTLAWFRAKGIRRIAIYTLTGNPRAAAFWRRHGFEPTMRCMERLLDISGEERGA